MPMKFYKAGHIVLLLDTAVLYWNSLASAIEITLEDLSGKIRSKNILNQGNMIYCVLNTKLCGLSACPRDHIV